MDTDGQDHHWWREVLTRLYGGQPYSADGTKVTYNSDSGVKALQFLTDIEATHQVGSNGFMNRGQDAFKAGKAGDDHRWILSDFHLQEARGIELRDF